MMILKGKKVKTFRIEGKSGVSIFFGRPNRKCIFKINKLVRKALSACNNRHNIFFLKNDT